MALSPAITNRSSTGRARRTDVYTVPVYRRPSNLFVRGFKQSAPSLPNSGSVYRKIGRRKLIPYYDRAEIEDGAIAGRGLEICWLKSQTDLLFTQIQGSARVRLEDGSTIRINYDSYNGYPYTAVGRILIERNIVPKDQMSMQRIRQWMDDNPDGANELRRQNRSYVFFHEVKLSDKDEAIGAQGVPLTPGRSIAVDKSLHVYGTPFFIEGGLPIESEQAKTPFHRLMIAQDTGSAILGPARADIYFGAGPEAGRVSGRLRHTMHFVILVPNSLDPVARGRTMPLPEARPSAKIAKLFPPTNQKPDDRKTAPQTVCTIHCYPGGRAGQGCSAVPRRNLRRQKPFRCRRLSPKSGPVAITRSVTAATIVMGDIATHDETFAPSNIGSASAVASASRVDRRRARIMGKRRETSEAAAKDGPAREIAARDVPSCPTRPVKRRWHRKPLSSRQRTSSLQDRYRRHRCHSPVASAGDCRVANRTSRRGSICTA